MTTSPSTPTTPPDHPLRPLRAELALARAHSEALIEGLDPDQVMWRPHPDSSAIGWHLGHQAAVAHYLMRNLTAAEPSLDPTLDRLFDSANPERGRGELPPLDELLAYRAASARAVDTTVAKIERGEVGAPDQLSLIAGGMVRAMINHEYQHATWIAEVRATLTDAAAPEPRSTHLILVDGYQVLDVG